MQAAAADDLATYLDDAMAARKDYVSYLVEANRGGSESAAM